MTMDKNRKYELLYASFDRVLSPEEKYFLEEALKEDPMLRKEKEEITEIRTNLKAASFRFKPGFSNRVLEKIREEGNRVIEMDVPSQLFSLFRKVAITGVAAIIILLLSIYLTSGSLNKSSVLGVDSFSDDNLVSYLLYEDFGE